MPTKYRFTGQYLESSFNLYWYRSRWYDQSLGRFIQPDTLVPDPGDPVAFDRYHYSRNSPLRYVDPSGHGACSGPYYVPECEETDQNGDGVVGKPYQEESNYDPGSDSIPGWDDEDLTDQSVRENRAGTVWKWLCSSGGWWGNSCPGAKDLAIILLMLEGGTLLNHLTNDKFGEQGVRIMVGLFAYLFTDDNGITLNDLSRFTAFFDPMSSQNGFTAEGWEKLTNSSNIIELFQEKVDRYWGSGPYLHQGHIVDRWWKDDEQHPCTQCITVLKVDIPIDDTTIIFGYIP